MVKPPPLVRLPPNASIYRFGTPTTAPRSSALLRFPTQGWTINRDDETSNSKGKQREGWAIVGDAEGRKLVVETLLSRHRIHPQRPPPGPFPYITHFLESSPHSSSPSNSISYTAQDPPRPIRHLAFSRTPPTGEFTDFTARYGSLLESDKLTTRTTLSQLHPTPTPSEITKIADLLRISHLLDLPNISLSSGQNRRARIAAALLTRPVLLILEDPMAGLDVKSRKEVEGVLGEVNKEMRVVLVLRGKEGEGLVEWVTDVVEVKDGEVWVGSRSEWEAKRSGKDNGGFESDATIEEAGELPNQKTTTTEPVVVLRKVSVSYGEGTRPVLKDVSWTVRPGEKWHLQGSNGSGKTTLLSLILGHHPCSFSLPPSTLTLFSQPRRSIPTPNLRKLIGHTSPEIYQSFPRGMGLSAYQAISTGFDGVFSRRECSPAQKERVIYLLNEFLDLLRDNNARAGSGLEDVRDVGNRLFARFTPPQQGLLLFLRAIVGRTPLLILDEPSQGLDESIWERCKVLLEREWRENPEQAVVVVSHYEDEVPWRKGQGRVLRLDEGIAMTD